MFLCVSATRLGVIKKKENLFKDYILNRKRGETSKLREDGNA